MVHASKVNLLFFLYFYIDASFRQLTVFYCNTAIVFPISLPTLISSFYVYPARLLLKAQAYLIRAVLTETFDKRCVCLVKYRLLRLTVDTVD